MDQFVCWTVSGLRRQGEHEVWVLLETFASEDAARRAAAADWSGRGVAETRVMPYYRAERPRPHIRGAAAATPATAIQA